MTKTTHQPRLEVFPERSLLLGYPDGSEVQEHKYYVRLRSGNGAKLMRSEDYDSNGSKSNALRAARSVNRITATPEFPNGRLHIRVLDEEGKVERTILPLQTEPTEFGIGDE